PREGVTRATESPPLVVSATPPFTAAHNHSPFLLRPGARSLSRCRRPPRLLLQIRHLVTRLSAFLFLFQQVRTGCPSRGYGGRRVQRTVPLPPNTLPESQTSAISRGVRRRVETSLLTRINSGSLRFWKVRKCIWSPTQVFIIFSIL
uniref:Uncharacterized protein n=1 Tax=Mus spicilegus TaxID=10103 RepID=A0A8C6HGZ9_MUSSI